MDATTFATLRRALNCLNLAPDAGRGLDALLASLFDALDGLPGLQNAAIVLIDAEDRPTIRARLGAPDIAFILSATLDRGPEAERARVLRPQAAPVLADADCGIAVPREQAAMLAAPVRLDGKGAGWLFVDGLLGPDASVTEDLQLTVLLADVVARLTALAATAAARSLDMAREVAFLRSKVSLRYRHIFSDGQSPALETLRMETDRAALSDAPLLLLGEPGTGRSVLARLIHELSPRALRPFASLDVSGGDQLALRLFGGSPSLGTGGGPGLLEETDGGTLLLEEAHCLPPDMAERLVQYLKTGSFTRVGGGRARQCATRLAFKAPPQGIAPELAAAAHDRTRLGGGGGRRGNRRLVFAFDQKWPTLHRRGPTGPPRPNGV